MMLTMMNSTLALTTTMKVITTMTITIAMLQDPSIRPSIRPPARSYNHAHDYGKHDQDNHDCITSRQILTIMNLWPQLKNHDFSTTTMMLINMTTTP